MANVTHVEWLNENASRAYPFMENCRRRPDNGTSGEPLSDTYAIPNCAIVDFVVTVPADTHGRVFYLKTLVLAGGSATFVVHSAERDGSSDENVASVTVGLMDGGQNVWQPFGGSGNYLDARGAIVVGDPEKLYSSLPDGIYTFQMSETMFEPRCVRPSIARVSAIRALNSGLVPVSKRLQGDVALISGSNVRLEYDEERNAIWIHADSNSGYNEKCNCAGESSRISTINGISADNVQIAQGDCIKVDVTEGVITISDTCAKPCCGCAELSYLNQKTSEISTSLNKLREFSEALNSRMTELSVANTMNSLSSGR